MTLDSGKFREVRRGESHVLIYGRKSNFASISKCSVEFYKYISLDYYYYYYFIFIFKEKEKIL